MQTFTGLIAQLSAFGCWKSGNVEICKAFILF